MDFNEDDDDSYVEDIRCDDRFHRLIQKITESNGFNYGIIIIICINAIFMAAETGDAAKDVMGEQVFKNLDAFFLFVYTLEFVLKIYAEPLGYWKQAYNLFDFFVLLLSWCQVIIEVSGGNVDDRLGAVGVFKALRTMRTLRTVSFIRGLQVLVTALVDTMKEWVIHIIFLLFVLMYLFAIMGYYFFGYQDDSDKEHWGSLFKSLLTLFSFVTVDGWTDLQQSLDDRGYGAGGRLYTIGFIIIGHFIFTNIFIGVIIMNISEASENYRMEQRMEREAALRNKKDFMMMQQHQDVKQMMERQKNGKYSNFQDMVQEFQRGLRHDQSAMMTELSTNVIWMETFIRTLDHMDNTLYNIQQLHFEMANRLAGVMEQRLGKQYGT